MEKPMLEFLYDAAREAKQKLQDQQFRGKRISRELSGMKRLPETGPQVPKAPQPQPQPQPQSREEVLKFERSLKKPMVYADTDQERAQKMVKESEHRPTNGIAIAEPSSGKNPFPGKSKYIADDKRKTQFIKLPNSKPGESEKKRKWTRDSECRSVKRKPEPLPEDVRKKIAEKARAVGEENFRAVLVIQKSLQISDIKRQQNRITIPLAQVENTFLTPEQDRFLGEKIGCHYNYMAVPIIEPSEQVRRINLRRWNVGSSSASYVLNGDWKDVVAFNGLRENQMVQLWAFWIREVLHFAFVILPDDQRDRGESVSRALALVQHPPQTSCLIGRGRDVAASTSQPQTSSAAATGIEDGSRTGASEVETATAENSEQDSVRQYWTLDLNMVPL